MNRIGWLAWIVGSAILVAGSSGAAAFDCTLANSPSERAICASPDLLEQDTALAKIYADRLAQDPDRAAVLRAEQRRWLTQRDKTCGAKTPSAATVAACLAGFYRSRLAALAPKAGPSEATAHPPGAVMPAAVLRAPVPSLLPDLPTRKPEAEAVLARTEVPAAGRSDVLLDVRVPGRFSIRAASASGVAVQVIDMISGPGDIEGEAGVKDGRIDALLDHGTYKIRTVGGDGAVGQAKLSVSAFHHAADISNALIFGGEADATLSDLEQRSFWVSIGKPGHVHVEAVGRSLGALHLWRNGTTLSDLGPIFDRVSPNSGHPLTRARIDGDVEPGLYLVTAYGGPKLAWTDGDGTEPFHLRTGPPDTLAGGWIDGVIGPMGSARFAPAHTATAFRLELPEQAPASLAVGRGGDMRDDTIAKNSREPVARVESSAGSGRLVEVTGQEGQPFRLRALDPSASRELSGTGPHWVGIDVAGEGGDEFPATVVLAQMSDTGGGRVLASNAPQIGPGKAWRQKLNFRGASSLLFEAKAATKVEVVVSGLRLDARIKPILGSAPLRTDGKTSGWTLDPGWYELRLTPIGGAFGIIDLTLGPPGLAVDAKPQSPRPSVPLGIQTFERGRRYQLFTNEAPALVLAPYARALPADLEASPLALDQEAGQGLDIPVRTPPRGMLAASGVNDVPIPVQQFAETATSQEKTVTLRLAAPERARGVFLSWSDPSIHASDPVSLPDPSEADKVVADRPRFFDLGRDASKSFALDVPDGGLYRVETLGRLHTSLSIATDFLPNLDEAAANGAGENALAQSYLRAGRYSVVITSANSSGRVGLLARPAALPEGGTLTPGTSVRAGLADARGVAFPIDIAEAGRYRLDLYSLGEPLRVRLEDQDGWPLTQPGPITAIERRFEPGRYRLVVLPTAVDRRAVVRLTEVEVAPVLSGHGPHPLPFDTTTAFQWHEPAGASEVRSPDTWRFALRGPADVSLDLSSGMIGDLMRDGEPSPVARIVAKSGYAGRLTAGRYRVEARSLGRNDRLDYTIALKARELQPGVARRIELPATIPFAIAEDRVVNLTSFGRIDLTGVLKDGDGNVVERLGSRTDDWNIGLSRRLPAGAYTLDLAAIPEPKSSEAAADDPDTPSPAKEAEKPADAAEPAADKADNAESKPGDEKSADDAPSTPSDNKDVPEAGDDKAAPATPEEVDTAEAEADETGVELHLALPDTVDEPALAASGEVSVLGAAVHRFALPSGPAGQLTMVTARAGSDLVLSLERGDAAGQWTVLGFDRSRHPLVAAPSDGDGAKPWRVSLWAIDGGPVQAEVAARVVDPPVQAGGTVAFEPVSFGDAAGVGVARIAAPSSGLLALSSRPDGLIEGSAPGRALRAVPDRILVPQAEAIWLVRRGPVQSALSIEPVAIPLGAMALTVPSEGRATFPKAPPPAGYLRLWRADSTFGQPGLAAGRGFGVAPGSAMALADDEPLKVWNAESSEPLAVRVSAVNLALRPDVTSEAGYTSSLSRGDAQPVSLAPGRKRVTLDLAAGTGAILGSPGETPTTVWTGNTAQTRIVDGTWTSLILANLSAETRPVRVMVAPLMGEPVGLASGRVAKRFFGASGSVSMRVEAQAGDRLVVAGADATFVADDGHVVRGRSIPVAGAGELTLDHSPGLVAAWIEGQGRSPWPDAKPQAIAVPSVVPLAGQAMALSIAPTTAALLHVRTSAPVILSLSQANRLDDTEVFPAGAEFHRLIAAGDASLRVYSPHDGPLGGSLELTASPVTPVGDGIGEAVALSPGGSALFGFEVRKTSLVGVGVRAEPDAISVRLLDGTGRSLGDGIAQFRDLDPGRYLLEASVPADGRMTVVRPAIVGLAPPPSGPPPDVIHDYMRLVGLAPAAPTH